jgi:hypothetical protein
VLALLSCSTLAVETAEVTEYLLFGPSGWTDDAEMRSTVRPDLIGWD